MSSPSKSADRRSLDTVHASVQFAAGAALEDTASSVRHAGRFARQLNDYLVCSAQFCFFAMVYVVPNTLCFSGAVKGTVTVRRVGCGTSRTNF